MVSYIKNQEKDGNLSINNPLKNRRAIYLALSILIGYGSFHLYQNQSTKERPTPVSNGSLQIEQNSRTSIESTLNE